MSIGSILVGIALAMVAAAYVTRPFRAPTSDGVSDQMIEGWVTRTRTQMGKRELQGAEPEGAPFCPRCGRRAASDDRFCARCGAQLPEDV